MRTIKYSLFDNSSNKVDLEQARSDRDLAQDRWRREQQNLAVELKSILAQKKDSSSRIDLAKKQIVMSEELVDINRTKYRTGMATVADVLKARAALAEARINLLNAQKDFAVSLAQLHTNFGPEPARPGVLDHEKGAVLAARGNHSRDAGRRRSCISSCNKSSQVQRNFLPPRPASLTRQPAAEVGREPGAVRERIPVKITPARKSDLEVTLPVFGAVTYVDKCDASYEESGSLIKDVPVLVGDLVQAGTGSGRH